jgi:pimeloyl-ACP methyl ester carboxylesterase
MIPPRFAFAFGACCFLCPAFDAAPTLASDPLENLSVIFRTFETDQVTLAPDGAHVAYTEHLGDKLFIAIRDLKTNKLVRIPIGVDHVEDYSGAREKKPASVSTLRWATADRLVFNLNEQNVWSLRADGTDPRALGDVNRYAGDALPPIHDPDSGDFAGAVWARSALEEFERVNQPVYVAAIPRGEPYVYVQALMKERGLVRYDDIDYDSVSSRSAAQSFQVVESNGSGTPRVVMRVNAENGDEEEWGQAPDSDYLLCDQQGRPRLAHAAFNIHNERQVARQFLYAPAKGGTWKPLDKLVKDEAAATFVDVGRRAFADRSIPIAFDYDSNVMYFASNAGRDAYGIFGLDTKTWQRTSVAIEVPGLDLIDPETAVSGELDSLVFDGWKRRLVGVRYVARERGTKWLDGMLAAVQKRLDEVDRAKHWEIVEWDKDRETFLVLGTSKAEPGVYCLYRPKEGVVTELKSRAPWLGQAGRNPGTSFGFTTPAGVSLTGYITAPLHPLLKRPPLVVLCHDGPWSRDLPAYESEAQALAYLGFIVLQVNYRGSMGFGRKHLEALRAGFDTVAIDDIVAALDGVVPKAVDRRLVAIMGRGYGGYLALRALQLHPDRFRCAVAIDAPTDLAVWVNELAGTYVGERRRAYFGDDAKKLRAASPAAHADLLKNPVMIVQADANSALGGRALGRTAEKENPDSVFLPLNGNEAAPLPLAKAALFEKISGFLNANIYNYAVKIGAMQVVQEPSKPTMPKPELPKPEVTAPAPILAPPPSFTPPPPLKP